MSISALRSTSGIPALADRTIADTILQKDPTTESGWKLACLLVDAKRTG